MYLLSCTFSVLRNKQKLPLKEQHNPIVYMYWSKHFDTPICMSSVAYGDSIDVAVEPTCEI